MLPFEAFRALVAVISGERERETREHMAFLEFYRQLVEVIPIDIARDFDSIPAPTNKGQKCHIQLDATDYLWWKNVIIEDRARFVVGTQVIQRNIWDRLAKMVKRDESVAELQSILFSMDDQTLMLSRTVDENTQTP